MGERPWLGLVLCVTACSGDDRAPGHDEDTTGATELTSASGNTAQETTDSSSTSGSATSVDGDASESSASDDDGGTPPGAGPRYDEVRQKSAHNAFQRREAFIDQLVYHRVRSLELDIHNGKSFSPSLQGDWYVYHTDVIDDGTSCVHLSDCLEELAIFHRAVPQHAVITVWIDLKDDFASSHTPVQLDALLEAHLGDAMVSPSALVAACPGSADVRSAVADSRCGWPSVAALEGRFFVALTGGGLGPGTRLGTYLQDRGDAALAFVAPGIGNLADIDQAPHDVAVVVNLAASQSQWASDLAARRLVTRVWTLNGQTEWMTAVNSGANHLATDKINLHQDPWAVTHDDDGWPFSCIEPCAPFDPEPAALVGLQVDSGDIWSTADDGWFLHDDLGASPDGHWQAFISTPNSHVEKFAKGCLMARTGLQANAAYLAVCRPADDERLRVQIRPSTGAQTTATDHDIVPSGTVDPKSIAFVRLVVENAGMCAAGFGSRDGQSWVPIASACFDGPLRHQGLAASSHDGGEVRFLFGNVRRNQEAARTSSDFAQSSPLGSGSVVVFDGPFP